MVEDLDEKCLKLVNSSGYPFQIAVRHAVEQSTEKHHWTVFAEEFPWRSEVSTQDGFIDLILVNSFRSHVILIECKRVTDSGWIFLLPWDRQTATKRTTSWVTRYDDWCYWLDWEPEPKTYESKFCVIPGTESGRKTMIEREASKLVEATESLAKAEKSAGIVLPHKFKVYSPVIVTNANLKICKFNSQDENLESGKLDDASFEDISAIRFRKSLKTRIYQPTSQDEEQTVFVVNSCNLLTFLAKFKSSSVPQCPSLCS